MKSYRLLQSAFLFLLLTGQSVFAKDYIVDLVIFEHLTPIAPADYSNNLYFPIVRNPVQLDSANAENSGFLLEEKNPEMESVAKRLDSSSRYQLVDHISWRQPGMEAEVARPVKLAYGDTVELFLPANAEGDHSLIQTIAPGTEVDPETTEVVESTRLAGSVSLSLGRFLHIDTNLVLIHPNGTGSARMQAHRRMRSNEVHYIDNPRFGLVVMVTPVPDPEEDADQPEEES